MVPQCAEIAYAGCTADRCNIYAITPDAAKTRQITSGQTNDWHPDWGINGIVFDSSRNGGQQIWFIASDGAGLKQLTNPDVSGDFPPRWDVRTGGYVFSRTATETEGSNSSIWSIDNSGTQTRLTFLSGFFARGDLDGDGSVTYADLLLVKQALGKRSGQAGFDTRADLNGDGIIDIRDLSSEAQKLPVGTKCQ